MKNLFTLAASIIIVSFSSFSQPLDRRQFSSVKSAAVDELIQLPNGGMTILSHLYGDNLLYSVDANGVIMWAKEIPPLGNRRYFNAESFVRMGDGSYVIAGTLDQNIAPRNIIVLVKIDKNGNLLWSKQFAIDIFPMPIG